MTDPGDESNMKPLAYRVSKKKFQEMESKASEESSLTIAQSMLLDAQYLMAS